MLLKKMHSYSAILFIMMWYCMKVISMEMSAPKHDNNSILIGFLGSFEHNRSAILIAGAATLAVEHVNNRTDLLPDHVLKFIPGDSGQPNSSQAIHTMTQMKDDGVVAFIGPDHDCACAALTAAAWNLPMISYHCTDQKLSEKKIYTTFARTYPTVTKITNSVIALLLNYNWTTIRLIVSEQPSSTQVEEAFMCFAKEHEITVTKIYHLPLYHNSATKPNFTEIIEDSRNVNRVYVLLTEYYVLLDFVRAMNSSNLAATGLYQIIYVEHEKLRKGRFQFIKDYEGVALHHVRNSLSYRNPFRSALIIEPTYTIPKALQEQIRIYGSRKPFNIPYLEMFPYTVPPHASLLYDAIVLYARAATDVLKEGKSLKDGKEIFNHINSTEYESVLNFTVKIDKDGNAEGNYALLGIAASDEEYNMLKVGSFVYQKGGLPSVSVERDIHWINKKPPLAEPECGFWGKKCHNESGENKSNWALISTCSACVTTVVVGLACSFRYLRYERKLACLLWKIDPKDIILTTPTSWQNVTHFDKEEEPISVSEEEELVTRKEDTNRMIGLYKGNTVYIKPICKQSIEITRSLRKEITQIREMRHENINPFIGACVDPSHICIVSLYCARSSLKVILKNSDINLDNMFIASLVADLTKGMTYIHESEIVSHGNLKSSTCLVDSRWVLQITSFGLHEFKAGRQLTMKGKKKRLKGLLWRAPELLRAVDPPERGTQKGDVYSFAIILHEVLGRKGPWGPRIISRKSIVERVTMKPAIYDGQPYRPSISSEVTNRWPDSVIRCLQECWWENPARRPDFRSINVKLREMFSELKSNIFDNMLSIMEKYASDLEGLVQERTHLLTEEKKKTEHLLLRMLPKPVAEQLKRGETVDAESFDSVTIYFSDIVGFTALSAVSTPLQVVDLLNDLYTCFDKIIGGFDVYKVETIGDAYMVVSGLPIRNGDCHAPEIAAMALHLLDAIRRFEIRHRPGDTLKLRIGIHSGPCVAGVVGSKMPRYCLFGDTVNTASRMESTGEPLKIHVSSSFQEILEKFDEFDVRERGVIQIKGKGEMKTYWLIGRSAKFTSLSDDAKLRRHTDSRLEVRFPPRVSASARNLRTASATRSCQWPLKIDSPPMSVSSCSALQTRKAARKSKWLRI